MIKPRDYRISEEENLKRKALELGTEHKGKQNLRGVGNGREIAPDTPLWVSCGLVQWGLPVMEVL